MRSINHILIVALSILLFSCATAKHDNFNRRKYFKHHLKPAQPKQSQTTDSKGKTAEILTIEKSDMSSPAQLINEYEYKEALPHLSSKAKIENDTVQIITESTKLIIPDKENEPELNPASTNKKTIITVSEAPNIEVESNRSNARRNFDTLFFLALSSFLLAWLILILTSVLNAFLFSILAMFLLVVLAWILSIIALGVSRKVPQNDRDTSFKIQMVLLFTAAIGIGLSLVLGVLLILYGF